MPPPISIAPRPIAIAPASPLSRQSSATSSVAAGSVPGVFASKPAKSVGKRATAAPGSGQAGQPSPLASSSKTTLDQKDEPRKKLHRGRNRLSCAECRRLKLKCSRVWPCTTCERRGCGHLCPQGETRCGKNGRLIDATNEELHNRIAQLEVALAQGRDRNDAPHPLLSSSARYTPRPGRDRYSREGSETGVLTPRGDSADEGEYTDDGVEDDDDEGDDEGEAGEDEEERVEAHAVGSESSRAERDDTSRSGVGEGEGDDADDQMEGTFGTLVVDEQGGTRFVGSLAASAHLRELEDPDSEGSKEGSEEGEVEGEEHRVEGVLSHVSQSTARFARPEPSATQVSTKQPKSNVTTPAATPGSSTSRPSVVKRRSADKSTSEKVKSELVHLRAKLPDWDKQGKEMVRSYWENVNWIHQVIPKPTFDNDFLMNAYDTETVPHPHKLACVFLVMALGVMFDLNRPPFDPLSGELYTTGKACFDLIGLDHACLATVQAMHLMGTFILNDNHHSGTDIFWPMLGSAIKVAQSLGLHRDAERFGLQMYDVEERRQVYWELLQYDRTQALSFGRNKHSDTKFPEAGEQFLADEAGYHYAKHLLIKLMEKVINIQIHILPTPYSEVAALDAELEKFWRGLPDSLMCHLRITDLPLDSSVPRHVALQRFGIRILISQTRLHLNRAAFAKALKADPQAPARTRFSPSFVSVHHSAQEIVHVVKQLVAWSPSIAIRWWFFWFHAFSSAICLAAICIQAPTSSFAHPSFTGLSTMCDLAESAENGTRAKDGLPVLLHLRSRARVALSVAAEEARKKASGKRASASSGAAGAEGAGGTASSGTASGSNTESGTGFAIPGSAETITGIGNNSKASTTGPASSPKTSRERTSRDEGSESTDGFPRHLLVEPGPRRVSTLDRDPVSPTIGGTAVTGAASVGGGGVASGFGREKRTSGDSGPSPTSPRQVKKARTESGDAVSTGIDSKSPPTDRRRSGNLVSPKVLVTNSASGTRAPTSVSTGPGMTLNPITRQSMGSETSLVNSTIPKGKGSPRIPVPTSPGSGRPLTPIASHSTKMIEPALQGYNTTSYAPPLPPSVSGPLVQVQGNTGYLGFMPPPSQPVTRTSPSTSSGTTSGDHQVEPTLASGRQWTRSSFASLAALVSPPGGGGGGGTGPWAVSPPTVVPIGGHISPPNVGGHVSPPTTATSVSYGSVDGGRVPTSRPSAGPSHASYGWSSQTQAQGVSGPSNASWTPASGVETAGVGSGSGQMTNSNVATWNDNPFPNLQLPFFTSTSTPPGSNMEPGTGAGGGSIMSTSPGDPGEIELQHRPPLISGGGGGGGGGGAGGGGSGLVGDFNLDHLLGPSQHFSAFNFPFFANLPSLSTIPGVPATLGGVVDPQVPSRAPSTVGTGGSQGATPGSVEGPGAVVGGGAGAGGGVGTGGSGIGGGGGGGSGQGVGNGMENETTGSGVGNEWGLGAVDEAWFGEGIWTDGRPGQVGSYHGHWDGLGGVGGAGGVGGVGGAGKVGAAEREGQGQGQGHGLGQGHGQGDGSRSDFNVDSFLSHWEGDAWFTFDD